MRNCWSELGLDEATADNVVIKRAYARLLKQARPDDDPEGYQRLREAYDAALEQARWMRHRQAMEAEALAGDLAEGEGGAQPVAHAAQAQDRAPAEGGEPSRRGESEYAAADVSAEAGLHASPGLPEALHFEVLNPQAEAGEDARPSAETEAGTDADTEEAMPGWFPPEQLVESLVAHWRKEGDEVLPGAWPVLVGYLDGLPYALRGEASVRFADLVLEHADLPQDFARALAAYFGWLTDFRSEAQLGLPRAHALRDRLEQARSLAEEDPVFAQRLERLQRLRRLRSERGAWPAWLFAFLHLPSLYMLMPGLTAPVLGSLGIGREEHAGLLRMMEKLGFLRLLPVAFLGAYCLPSNWKQGSTTFAALGLVFMAVLMLLAMMAGTAFLRRAGWVLLQAAAKVVDVSTKSGYRFTLFASLGGPVICGGVLLLPDLMPSLPEHLQGATYSLLYSLLFVGSVLAFRFVGSAAPTVGLCWGLAAAAAIDVTLQPEPMPAGWVLVGTALWINLTLFLLHRYPQQMEKWALDPWRVMRPSTPIGWLFVVVAIKFYVAVIALLLVALLPAAAVTTGRNLGTGFVVSALALAVALGQMLGLTPMLYFLCFIGTLHVMCFAQRRADALAERLYSGRWRMAAG